MSRQKRKSPIYHHVRQHNREDYDVNDYDRGHGHHAWNPFYKPASSSSPPSSESKPEEKEKGKSESLKEWWNKRQIDAAKNRLKKQQEQEEKSEKKNIEELGKAKREKEEAEKKTKIQLAKLEVQEEREKAAAAKKKEQALKKKRFQESKTGRIFSGIGKVGSSAIKELGKKQKARPKRKRNTSKKKVKACMNRPRIHLSRPAADPKNKTFFENYGGYKVYLINGEWAREKNIDFALGGHHRRYPFIPRNEIWIEKGMHHNDQEAVMIHEAEEARLMKSGMPYPRAHARANIREMKFRVAHEPSPNDGAYIEDEVPYHTEAEDKEMEFYKKHKTIFDTAAKLHLIDKTGD